MSDHGQNQHTKLTWTDPSEYEVGAMADIPIRLSSNTLVVRCRIVGRRTVFGRVEWQIAPVSGRGDAWIQERTVSEGEGVATVSEAKARRWQEAADDEPEAEPTGEVPDLSPGFASRTVRRS